MPVSSPQNPLRTARNGADGDRVETPDAGLPGAAARAAPRDISAEWVRAEAKRCLQTGATKGWWLSPLLCLGLYFTVVWAF